MTIKKIQELSGFSESTISRVLNGKAKEFRISQKTADKILHIAELLNYRPNRLAKSLRLKKTMTMGLIISDILNPFWGEIAARVENLFRHHGYSTILCNSNENLANEEFYLKVLEDQHVDGIIISPFHTEEWAYMKSLRDSTRPLVLIDRIFYNTNLPWVISDNTFASETMADEMIRLGFKRIAYLGGIKDTYINDVRYKGFQNAFNKNSVVIDENMVLFQEKYSPENDIQKIQYLFDKNTDIDAIFCINNLVLFRALKVIKEWEAKNNKQLLLSAFDVGRFINLIDRPLIYADQDLNKVAEAAVNLLLALIEGKYIENRQIMLPFNIKKHLL